MCIITLIQKNINCSFILYYNNAIYITKKPNVTQCNQNIYYYSLPIKKASNKGGLNKYIAPAKAGITLFLRTLYRIDKHGFCLG
jgi:hypothetical protein